MADDEGNTTVLGSRVLTIPNLISVARLLCLPVFLWLLFSKDNRAGAAYLLAVLGASDWVDGYIARRFNQVSELGKLLDPTADRLLFIVGVAAIVIDGSVPLWIAIALLVREGLVSIVAVIIGILGARRMDVTWWGKTGTFALLFAFPCFLAGESTIIGRPAFAIAAWIFAIPGLLISWWAGLGYVPEGLRALREGRAARNGA